MRNDRLRSYELGAPERIFDLPPPARFVGDGASVTFTEAVKRGLRSSVYGRASRSEFWYFWLFLTALNVLSFVMFVGAFDLDQIDRVFASLISISTLVAFIRRLHDVNKSGWWVLIAFTLIGIVPLLIWSVRKGDPQRNRFDLPGKAIRGASIAVSDPTATIDHVERLHRLRVDGAISEDEFQALKKRAL